MRVKRDNPGAFDTIRLQLRSLQNAESRVGWFSSSKYKDGTPVAYVMAIQELGSPANNIPPRPTGRPTAIKHRQEWAATAGMAAKEVLAGRMTAIEALDLVATQAEGDWFKAITELMEPELSPVTIEIRAMKKKDPTMKVTKATVWQAIRNINKPGYVQPNVSTKPLNDSGMALATLTHVTTGS